MSRLSTSSSLAVGREMPDEHRRSGRRRDCRGRSAAAAPPAAPPSYSGSARNSLASSSVPAPFRDDVDDRAREREIEHARQLVDARVHGGVRRVHVATSRLRRRCGSSGCRAPSRAASIAGTNCCQNSGLTCCAVSMRKPSTPISVDPAAVDVDHPLHDARILGEDVVEADEVAHRAGFAAERAVAAVVIVDRVVEPGRHLDVALGRRDLRRCRRNWGP